MEINDPQTVAELQSLDPRIEDALLRNGAETLIRMFWASPHVMQFGAAENLSGNDEIAAFRKSRPGINLARTIQRMDIVTFGRDFASITLEFERAAGGKSVTGRQSQVWVRLPEGWRIVAVHCSLLP